MENPWALLNPETLHDPNFNETEQQRMQEGKKSNDKNTILKKSLKHNLIRFTYEKNASFKKYFRKYKI
jgi:hypothetical protein